MEVCWLLLKKVTFFLFWFCLLDYVRDHFPSFLVLPSWLCAPQVQNSLYEFSNFRSLHTIIDSTFLDSLHSTTLGFDLHSNELIGMHLGLILHRSCMDLPNLGVGPLCYVELIWGRGLLLKISLSSPLSWYTVTQSWESYHFSLKTSSSCPYKIIFCYGSKLSLLRKPAPSLTGTMTLYP